jgi:hypothetical protein
VSFRTQSSEKKDNADGAGLVRGERRQGVVKGRALSRTGGHCGRRLVSRRTPDQNRNCGPKVMRMLLRAPLLKKMLSPISARTPMGPAKPSIPPPGYTAK